MWDLLRRLRFLRFDRRGVDHAGLEMVDVDSLMMNPRVLRISSSMPGLARKAAEFLAGSCGGKLTEGPAPPGPSA